MDKHQFFFLKMWSGNHGQGSTGKPDPSLKKTPITGLSTGLCLSGFGMMTGSVHDVGEASATVQVLVSNKYPVRSNNSSKIWKLHREKQGVKGSFGSIFCWVLFRFGSFLNVFVCPGSGLKGHRSILVLTFPHDEDKQTLCTLSGLFSSSGSGGNSGLTVQQELDWFSYFDPNLTKSTWQQQGVMFTVDQDLSLPEKLNLKPNIQLGLWLDSVTHSDPKVWTKQELLVEIWQIFKMTTRKCKILHQITSLTLALMFLYHRLLENCVHTCSETGNGVCIS